MAKKSRKVLKQASQQRAIQQAAANITTALTAATAQAAAAPKSASARAAGAPEDYRYVKSDLRRISILAASFTAILIALSFVIR